MLRAHRQAWCWQDEWTDLTMEDIRQLEEETARMLAQKMAKCGEAEEPSTAGPSPEGRPEPGGASGQEGTEAQGTADISPDDSFAKQWSTSSRSSYSSQHGGENGRNEGPLGPVAAAVLWQRCIRTLLSYPRAWLWMSQSSGWLWVREQHCWARAGAGCLRC